MGDAFNEGLYEVQARLKGIPLLESRPKYHMRQMIAKEACQSQKVIFLSILKDRAMFYPLDGVGDSGSYIMLFLFLKVISLPRVIRVADVASILRSNKHNGFPVSIAFTDTGLTR